MRISFIIQKSCKILLSFLWRFEFLAKFPIYNELIVFLKELAYRSLSIRLLARDTSSLNIYSKKLKQSDNLYILGSGFSINEITKEEWAEISHSDSIGFNFFLLHEFVPKYYFFETPVGERFNIFKAIYLQKKDKYAEVPIFINNIHMHEANKTCEDYAYLETALYYTPICLRTFRTKILSIVCGVIDIVRKKLNRPFSTLFHHSGTLSILLDFAYLNRYKKIYLIGFDMSDPRYFFQDYKDDTSKALLNVLDTINDAPNKSVHLTIDKKHNNLGGLLPLDEYIIFFYEKFLKKK